MVSSQDKYREHGAPRISANQLAEYTLASPTRRHGILRNAKYPPTFLVIRYGPAKDAICNFLSDDNRRRETLYQAEMEQREAANSSGTDFASNDALLSAEAIRAFAATQLPGTFNNITFRRNSQSLPKLGIEGVDVSVSLDLIARNRMKETVGGAIVQTSKAVSSKSWRDEHSSCVASLVWMLCTKHLKSFGDVDRKLCFAIDVFAKKVTLAPANYKRLLRDIETSCREIAVLWDQIPPPADYVAAE